MTFRNILSGIVLGSGAPSNDSDWSTHLYLDVDSDVFYHRMFGEDWTSVQSVAEDTSTAGVITASKTVVANAAGAISNVGGHLSLNSSLTATDNAGKNVRINSITNTGTANPLVGVQIKPAQGASMSNGVTGLEVSPRVNDTFALSGAGGTIIGTHSDVYLKGTSAGTIAGDVRALNLELVTDDAGTRAITGNVNAIRVRAAFSGTISGKMVPIRIEKAETQTGSEQWDAVLELPSTLAGIWNDAPGTEPTTADGYIKVLVNGNARYIQLYSGAPVD